MTQTPDETGVRGGLSDVTPPPPHGQGMVQAPPTHLATLPPPRHDIGKVRSTGMCFLLMVVTLGLYSVFWFYGTHAEMQRHRHSGVGGGVALLLGLFLPVVMFFITPSEVSAMYAARGQRQPVSAATGCWIFLPFVGIIVWFVKTNGALNDYWRSLGAV
ncbi:DUF4234 domain-containing protein [Knoellia sp. CPCC 206453]|uniref:DUF4234 domain-containing protein n=1 Tax=Knoellia pratensis TaxID=3404796 RepID=UPI00360CCB7D